MAHAALTASVLLVLGVVTSASVAWLPARFLPRSFATATPIFDRQELASGDALATAFTRECAYSAIDHDGREFLQRGESGNDVQAEAGLRSFRWNVERVAKPPRWSRLDAAYAALGRPDGRGEYVITVEAGWPLSCVWGAAMESHQGILTTFGLAAVGPINSAPPLRAIAVAPLWPGLAADTAFYSAAWWLILFVPRRLRRTLRRRRGLCPACRYDLRGLPPGALCPECGAARSPASAAPPTTNPP
jgi:hypothetical protein